ncbi:MAG: response regulator [Oxalobacteraceae bacterium]|nr:MAG: response regulator [Oxalobacteraceae bacterium]
MTHPIQVIGMLLATSFTPLSILLVDDEEPIRDVLSWMLEDFGHTVHPATDGYKALAFLRVKKPVDIVLSDINMPGMDGVALCRAIEAEFPSLPVLLISGRPRPDGVKAFVAKPFRADILTREIARLASDVRKVQFDEPQHAH